MDLSVFSLLDWPLGWLDPVGFGGHGCFGLGLLHHAFHGREFCHLDWSDLHQERGGEDLSHWNLSSAA